jgi:Cu/Ag efflux pump CusA
LLGVEFANRHAQRIARQAGEQLSRIDQSCRPESDRIVLSFERKQDIEQAIATVAKRLQTAR